MYYYNYSFGSPSINYFSNAIILYIAIGVAALLGLIFFFTFLRKKNERKFHGGTKKVYDFFSFNRFFAEDIVKLIYIVSAFAATVGGIFAIFIYSLPIGLGILIGGNLILRLAAELVIVLMVMVRRVVSIDRKMSKIEKFYEDDYSDWESKSSCGGCGVPDEDLDEDEEEFTCTGHCNSCGEACSPEFREEHEIIDNIDKSADEKASAYESTDEKVSLSKDDAEEK